MGTHGETGTVEMGALGKGSVGGAGGVSSGVQVGGGGTHGEGLGSKTGRWSWDR